MIIGILPLAVTSQPLAILTVSASKKTTRYLRFLKILILSDIRYTGLGGHQFKLQKPQIFN